MRILVTPTFQRAAKKFHPKQKTELDDAVRAIAGNSALGEPKLGDLAGVRVYKFRMAGQLYLLAYRVIDDTAIKLLTVGNHENFYRDLKLLDD